MNIISRSWVFLLLLTGLACFNMTAQESREVKMSLTGEPLKDAESLKEVITGHLANGKPELAIPYMEALLALGDSSGSTPGEQAWLYLQLADGYGKRNEEKLAAESLLKAVPLAGREFGTNTKDYQDFVVTVANTLFGAGHYQEAEPLYLELFQADTLYDAKKREAEICMNLFSYYGESGQYNKIRPVLERLLPYLEPVSTPEQFAGNLHTLGFLLFQEGRYDLAEKQMLESLNRFSFPAISSGNGEVLSDRYTFTNLSSTCNLVTGKTTPEIRSGKVFGGIDYNRGPATEAPRQVNPAMGSPQSNPEQAAFRNLRGSAWEFLPATRTEASKVSQLLQQGNLQVTAITGSEATEESFKEISENSPSVIHVASHGFSIPQNEGDSPATGLQSPALSENIARAENPLMRSGLLFAGANQAWQHGTPPVGREDGILTAYEISHLDLSSTSLAVLSACQTGLGDIRGNEGVYGLQRAFSMAGVKNLVVSLWEVPDLETMELMDCFYNHLVNGNLPESAFRKAQDKMKEKYRNQPSLWAGFVFIR